MYLFKSIIKGLKQRHLEGQRFQSRKVNWRSAATLSWRHLLVLGKGDRIIIWAPSWQKTAARERETSRAFAILQGWSDRPGEPKGLEHMLSFPFKILGKFWAVRSGRLKKRSDENIYKSPCEDITFTIANPSELCHGKRGKREKIEPYSNCITAWTQHSTSLD